MILDAWGWCTGTTQRDGMGREVGVQYGERKKKKIINKFSFKNQPPEVLRWLRDRMGIPLSPPQIQQRII